MGLPIGGGGLGIGTIIVLGLIGYAFGIDPRILIGGAEMLSHGSAPSYQADRRSPGKTGAPKDEMGDIRSEEHTSESSHQIISYAVFCLKKKQKRDFSEISGLMGNRHPNRLYIQGQCILGRDHSNAPVVAQRFEEGRRTGPRPTLPRFGREDGNPHTARMRTCERSRR